MKIEYRKIFNKNYVILTKYNIHNYSECYRSKMLKNNLLDNFLTYSTQNINGEIQFNYDISSKQSIFTFYENCNIDYDTIRHMILSVKSALDTLDNYLLEPDYMVLNPELIYMNVATKTIYFCYCPGEKNNFYSSLNEFLCYLLSKIDHSDNNSIVLAYSLQQQSMNENYTIDDLIDILNNAVLSPEKNIAEQEPPQDIISPVSHSSDDTFFDDSELTLPPTSPVSKKAMVFPRFVPIALPCTAIIFIFYSRVISNLFSLELTIFLVGICLFILFNMYTFYKNHPAVINNSAPPDTPLSTDKIPSVNNFVDNTSDFCYEDTVLLGYRGFGDTPKLVYTGTDFSSENEINHFPFLIGKMQENVDMVIDNRMISRIHARIFHQEGSYYIEDMNSSNGTYLNDQLIQPHVLTEISTGDYITFSHLTYIFQ